MPTRRLLPRRSHDTARQPATPPERPARPAPRWTGWALAASVVVLALVWLAYGLARPLTLHGTLDEQVRRLAMELRCPICQGQSVAESNSQVAIDMRDEIRRFLLEGRSPDAILQYYVQRYGDWVLNSPPRRGWYWALWAAPLAGLLAAGFVAVAYVRRHRAPAETPAEVSAPADPPASAWDERLRERLRDYL